MDDVIISRFAVNPKPYIKKDYTVRGFDTETHKGLSTLISDDAGRYLKLKDKEDVFSFLLNIKYRTSINFFFNLEYDTNAIIKHLDCEELRNLAQYNSVSTEVKDNIIKISIVPKKCLKISTLNDKRKSINVVKFFDIAKFYQIDDSINGLFKTYNTIFKTDEKKALDASKEFPLDRISVEDIAYCIKDSLMCKRLGEYFVSMTNELVNLKDFYSPASIGKALIRLNLKSPMQFHETDSEQYMAYNSYAGGRFEVIKRGNFSDYPVYMPDINSAYPYQLSRLMESSGSISRNKRYEDDATYSFFECDFKIPECVISPVKMWMDSLHVLGYPQGNFKKVFVTKGEFEILNKMGLNPVITEARHIFNENGIKPFRWIEKIYLKRLALKDAGDNRELILKLAMNSIYGCMWQHLLKWERRKDATLEELNTEDFEEISYCISCGYELSDSECVGDENNQCPRCLKEDTIHIEFRCKKYYSGQFFNPVYASEITARTRCRIFLDAMAQHEGKDTVMFATDAICFDKKPSLKYSRKLGDYSIPDKKMHAFILGSGIYSFYDDEGNIIPNKQKFRGGISKMDVRKMADINRITDECDFSRHSPMKLKESKRRFQDLNIFKEKDKKLRVNFDETRIWDWRPKTFRDLLENVIESRPLTI